ncbi:MAG TPA: hypothetical protein VMR97_09605 [Acidimicrobiales bacterium]|nr:hypothetical protein [Acidimicrobiales bacterium]
MDTGSSDPKVTDDRWKSLKRRSWSFKSYLIGLMVLFGYAGAAWLASALTFRLYFPVTDEPLTSAPLGAEAFERGLGHHKQRVVKGRKRDWLC